VQELVWSGENDFAVIAGPQGVRSLLVKRDGRAISLFKSVGASLSGLVASPHGRYFGARVGGSMSGAERSTAVTWSPDERFTALASKSAVYVYRGDRPGWAVTLPLTAIDLAWR
jgi:hypothetical protein